MSWVYIGYSSAQGSSHEQNEDAVYHSDAGLLIEKGVIALICDGVSSIANGRWAAHFVKDALRDVFFSRQQLDVEIWKKAIVEVNERMRGEGKRGACTLALIWMHQDILHCFSLGDTQIATLRRGYLDLHTEERQQGGRLTYFMGMKSSPLDGLVYKQWALKPDDLILVMSDGVSEIVQSSDISHLWRHCYEDPTLCAQRLVRLAAFSGSTDDNSAIVLHYT